MRAVIGTWDLTLVFLPAHLVVLKMDKQALKALVEKREILELEMNTIIARLTGPNQPGLQGGLVDKEV